MRVKDMEARHACCMLWLRATLLNPLDGGRTIQGWRGSNPVRSLRL